MHCAGQVLGARRSSVCCRPIGRPARSGEYRFAEYLNKRVFSARIGPLTGENPTRGWQQIDLYGAGPTARIDLADGGEPVAFLSEGLYRLWEGIVGAGVGAESFVWPPPKEPQRASYAGFGDLVAVAFDRLIRISLAIRDQRPCSTKRCWASTNNCSRRSGLAGSACLRGQSGDRGIVQSL